MREHLFYWAGPISSTRIVVISKKGSGIQIDNVDQLKNYRIGVLISDVGQQLVKEKGVPEQNIETAFQEALNEIKHDDSLQMVSSQKVDLTHDHWNNH